MTPYYQAPDTPIARQQHRIDTSLLVIFLFVASLHVLFLAFGKYWSPESPPQKKPQKVIVKTVQLNPHLQAVAFVETKQESSAASSTNISNPPLPTTLPKEEVERAASPAPMPVNERQTIKAEPEQGKTEPAVAIKDPEPVKEVIAETQTKPMASSAKPVKVEPKPKPILKQDAKPNHVKPANAAPKPKPTNAKKTPAKKPIAPAPVKTTAIQPAKKQPSPEELAKSRQDAEAALKKRELEIAAAEESERQYQEASKDILAKLKQSRHKVSAAVGSSASIEGTAGPQLIGNLHIDSLSIEGETGILGSKERSYSDEIGFRLKKSLHFPEYGSVKIKLTLDKTGKVIRVQTVDSENKTNQQYIEKTVPNLKFAAFGTHFDGASQYTFLITLNNDRQ